MPDFLDSCDRFCREYPCRVAGGIISAGVAVALFVLAQGIQIDRMARATEIESRSTTQSLDAHIGIERDNNERVMQALGEIQTDIAVVKFRLGSARDASGPEPVMLAMPRRAE